MYTFIPLFLMSLANADIAPEDPSQEPAQEPPSEDTSSDDSDKDDDSSSCNSVRPMDVSAMLLPIAILGGAIVLRREERAENKR